MKKNNYRKLPAQLPQVLGVGTIILSLSCTFALGILLFNLYTLYKQESMHKETVRKNLVYWQDIVKKHPYFPAAYYEVAFYSAQLEDKENAIESLQKALMIDPNFFQAEVFAKELGLKDRDKK